MLVSMTRSIVLRSAAAAAEALVTWRRTARDLCKSIERPMRKHLGEVRASEDSHRLLAAQPCLPRSTTSERSIGFPLAGSEPCARRVRQPTCVSAMRRDLQRQQSGCALRHGLRLGRADIRHEAVELLAQARAFARQRRAEFSTSSGGRAGFGGAAVDLHDVGGGFLRCPWRRSERCARSPGSPSLAAPPRWRWSRRSSEIWPMVPPISLIAATDSCVAPCMPEM